jgi:hypothetical protein
MFYSNRFCLAKLNKRFFGLQITRAVIRPAMYRMYKLPAITQQAISQLSLQNKPVPQFCNCLKPESADLKKSVSKKDKKKVTTLV